MRVSNAMMVGLLCLGWGMQAATAQVGIMCIGDSITAGYGVNIPYPTRLSNNTGLPTLNLGVGGMWASYGLNHIDGWLVMYDPSHVLIMYGTNDTNDPYQDYQASAEAVMETARRVRAYGAIPIVGTIPPKIGDRAYQMPRVEVFNGYLRVHTASEGILLADIELAFGSGAGLFQSDGFHPNDAGQEVIAQTFAAKIQYLSLEPMAVQVQDVGATGQSIAVEGNLPWMATANEAWITLTAGFSGADDGTIVYDVAPNTGAARTGTITVVDSLNSSTVVVTQAAATLEAKPTSFAFPSAEPAYHHQITVTANLPWTATANQSWISIYSGSNGVGNGITTFIVAANGTGAARSGTITFSVGETTRSVTINQWPASTWGDAAPSDFDGNGTAELAVYHPSTGNWYLSFGGVTRWTHAFGWSSAIPVPADYDGDGLQDFGVYHPASGNWYILESASGHSETIQFGWSATVPLPGDYDGDGVADLAVFYPAEGRWYFLCSTAGRYSVQWGWSTTIPVPADYDGDGVTDIGVYHPASGLWQILKSSTGGAIQKNWGWSSAIPVPADYDGDGKADIAVFHRASGTWYVIYSGGGSLTKTFGWSTTTPVAADYDGDGKDDLAVFHSASGNWYVLKSSTGGILTKNWGWSTTQPTLLYPLIHTWFGLP